MQKIKANKLLLSIDEMHKEEILDLSPARKKAVDIRSVKT